MKLRIMFTALMISAPGNVGMAAEKLQAPMSSLASLTVFDGKQKRIISFDDLIGRLQDASIICLGEIHDSEAHHRLQLHLLKALFARDHRLGVGLEIFQRPFQKCVDDYLAGSIGEDELLRRTEYIERWGYDWSLYRPVVDYCRLQRIPVAALNVPQELTKQVSRLGYDALNTEDKAALAGIDFHVKEHREHWFAFLNPDASVLAKERWYQVMTVWDGYMAASAAAFQKARGVHRMVVIAGDGHIAHGFGIPRRAARQTGGRVLTLGVQLGRFVEPTELSTDFLIFMDAP